MVLSAVPADDRQPLWSRKCITAASSYVSVFMTTDSVSATNSPCSRLGRQQVFGGRAWQGICCHKIDIPPEGPTKAFGGYSFYTMKVCWCRCDSAACMPEK